MSERLQDNRKVGWFWAYNKVIDEYMLKMDVYAFAVYMLLCRYAMNKGRVKCSLRFIAKLLRISLGKTSDAVQTLERAGIIALERDGEAIRTYILLDMIQDDERSLPEQHRSSDERERSLYERNRSPHEQHNNEVKTKTKSNIPLDAVEKVYLAYPRKVEKTRALKQIEKAVQRLLKGEAKVEITDEVAALRWLYVKVKKYAATRENEDMKYTPHPATWFSGSRYLDDVEVSSETSDSAGDSVVNVLDKVRRQLRGAK